MQGSFRSVLPTRVDRNYRHVAREQVVGARKGVGGNRSVSHVGFFDPVYAVRTLWKEFSHLSRAVPTFLTGQTFLETFA